MILVDVPKLSPEMYQKFTVTLLGRNVNFTNTIGIIIFILAFREFNSLFKI